MLRAMWRLRAATQAFATRTPSTYALRRLASSKTSLPAPPPLQSLDTSSENATAREWIEEFKKQEIPRTAVEMSFSRSSGPGGQNVNKVNTKATVRCALDSSWIPPWARPHLRKSPSYVSSSQCLQVTSTVYRSQAQNVADCLTKLHALVLAASSAALVNEPSAQQQARVRDLQRADTARRRADKDRRSAVKQGRGKGGWD